MTKISSKPRARWLDFDRARVDCTIGRTTSSADDGETLQTASEESWPRQSRQRLDRFRPRRELIPALRWFLGDQAACTIDHGLAIGAQRRGWASAEPREGS